MNLIDLKIGDSYETINEKGEKVTEKIIQKTGDKFSGICIVTEQVESEEV